MRKDFTLDEWQTIRRATSGTFQGQYWADRAIADVFEKTGVRLERREVSQSRYMLLEPSEDFRRLWKTAR